MKNIEKYNFEHNGCKIKFFHRPSDFDIDVIVSKGDLRKRYVISNIKQYRTYESLQGTVLCEAKDNTEERILHFKEMILKGDFEVNNIVQIVLKKRRNSK